MHAIVLPPLVYGFMSEIVQILVENQPRAGHQLELTVGCSVLLLVPISH